MRKKTLFYLLFISLLIPTIILIGLEPISNYYIKKKVKTLKVEFPSLSIDSIHFSPFKNRLLIKDIAFIDSTNGVDLKRLNIKVVGIDYLKLFNNQVLFDSLILDNLILKYKSTLSNSSKRKFSLYNIKRFTVKHLQIRKSKASYYHPNYQLNSEIESIDINADNIAFVPNKNITYDNFKGTIIKTNFNKLDQINAIIDKISFNENSFRFYRINLESETNSKLQETKVNAAIDYANLILDFETLQKSSLIHIKKIQIMNFNMKAFMDKRKPPNLGRKNLIAEMLHGYKQAFRVDNISLEEGRIEYEEKVEESSIPGKVHFTNFNANVENVTNDSLAITSNHNMLIEADCKLMDAATLRAVIKVDLRKDNQYHYISGNLESMELKSLNPTFLPLASIKFERGKLDKLEFDYYLNEVESEGVAKFYYHDLKVIIKNRKIFKRPKALSKIETFLANTFLFRSDNPKNGNFKEGKIAFRRDSTKSVFNFWWKSLFSGTTYTILNNPTQ